MNRDRSHLDPLSPYKTELSQAFQAPSDQVSSANVAFFTLEVS
jgi:hypothetical protein